ncbi:MAG: hypothetical protein OXB95_05095 [Rhodobacteraceae bacterium]|nr:hypothetical protein [Paracoccaceae bacterium]
MGIEAMALGRHCKDFQQPLFVATSDIKSPGHPFYRALNKILGEADFDAFAEEACAEFHAGRRGRPGIPPGVYFRMLLVGCFEGIGSERGFAHLLRSGGQEEIQKRMLLQAAAFNLGLLMSGRFGYGTPRALQGLATVKGAICGCKNASFECLLRHICRMAGVLGLFELLPGDPGSRQRGWHGSAAMAHTLT